MRHNNRDNTPDTPHTPEPRADVPVARQQTGHHARTVQDKVSRMKDRLEAEQHAHLDDPVQPQVASPNPRRKRLLNRTFLAIVGVGMLLFGLLSFVFLPGQPLDETTQPEPTTERATLVSAAVEQVETVTQRRFVPFVIQSMVLLAGIIVLARWQRTKNQDHTPRQSELSRGDA